MVNVATSFVVEPVPICVVPIKKATVDPSATAGFDATVAVNVTDWLTCEGLDDDASEVVVLAMKVFRSTATVPFRGQLLLDGLVAH